jgi:cell division protein FtsI/penicillin-binding protein 2
LLGAGATPVEVRQALSQAKVHPDEFEPVDAVSRARFDALKAAPGPDNVYNVAGTAFLASATRGAVTAQLAAHLVGTVGPITAEQLAALGPPYDASSQVGQTGLELAYERRLAGTPTTKIQVLSPSGAPLRTLARYRGTAAEPVHTSLDPSVQRAAESALAGVHVNVAMVAIRASTGQLLAVVSNPLGSSFNTALAGAYPPGSTFKVLTSAALIGSAGLTASSPATCTPTITVDGEPFHNAEGDRPVQTLDQAFTESCNTTFIRLALADLHPSDFAAVARQFGLDRTPRLGVPAFAARVPTPASRTELAATAIGQASVAFSPLGMGSVAASVDSGRVLAPSLVAGTEARVAPTPLPAGVLAGLQSMMGHVVQSGTAAGTGLPTGSFAKTGTAQYGSAGQLKLDGWLMGYRGDIAFAVVAQDTGGVDGGPFDGPMIARFLNGLGG